MMCGHDAAQAYIDDPRHEKRGLTARQIMDEHFARAMTLNEDWLAEVLDDSLDMDWTGRVGARAIIRAYAQAIEARSGETAQQARSGTDESAVAKPCAQTDGGIS